MIKYTHYYSKWRDAWIEFKQPPGDIEIKKLLQFNYKLK